MLASPSQQGTATSPFFLSSEDSYRFHDDEYKDYDDDRDEVLVHGENGKDDLDDDDEDDDCDDNGDGDGGDDDGDNSKLKCTSGLRWGARCC